MGAQTTIGGAWVKSVASGQIFVLSQGGVTVSDLDGAMDFEEVMIFSEKEAVQPKNSVSDLTVFVFLLLALFASNFLRSSDFGIYEDGLIRFIRNFDAPPTWAEVSSEVFSFFQGRPINSLTHFFISFIIWRTQSLFFTYLACCLFTTAGVYVWFKVFRKRLDFETSLLAALFIFLLPLHTLTEFMEGTASFVVAMVLSGVAILLINRDRFASKLFGYACALLTLMSYEFFFPLIYAGNFLTNSLLSGGHARRSFFLSVFFQAIVLTVILVGYSAFREYMGERVASALVNGSYHQALGDIIYSAGKGITTSFSYPWMIFQLRYLTAENVSFGLVVGLLVFFVFSLLVGKNEILGDRTLQATTIAQALIAAIALIALGYPFTYFFAGGRPEQLLLVGRESRVNIAGVIGHSLLLAIVLKIIWNWLNGFTRSAVRAILLAPLLVLLAIGRFGVQSDYVDMWSILKEEIRQVILLSPDATARTGIILEGGFDIYFPHFRSFPAIGWEPHGYNFILPALFQKPSASKDAAADETPIVQRVSGPKWPEGLDAAGPGHLRNRLFASDWTWPDSTFEVGNIIHLKEDSSFRLNRINDQVKVGDVDILKPAPTYPRPLGFWDIAVARPGLLHLMPDLALWFARYQQTRAVRAETPAAE